jgi:hypothetical protein
VHECEIAVRHSWIEFAPGDEGSTPTHPRVTGQADWGGIWPVRLLRVEDACRKPLQLTNLASKSRQRIWTSSWWSSRCNRLAVGEIGGDVAERRPRDFTDAMTRLVRDDVAEANREPSRPRPAPRAREDIRRRRCRRGLRAAAALPRSGCSTGYASNRNPSFIVTWKYAT